MKRKMLFRLVFAVVYAITVPNKILEQVCDLVFLGQSFYE